MKRMHKRTIIVLGDPGGLARKLRENANFPVKQVAETAPARAAREAGHAQDFSELMSKLEVFKLKMRS